MFLRSFLLGCVIAVGAATGAAAAGSPTLERVLATGTLRCGIVATPEDWNKIDLHGALGPLDIEICRAVSAAVLGERATVDLKPFPSELEAEQALSESKVDLIVGVSPEATAMWHWNISFGPPVFYDAQGILVRHDAPVSSIADLAGVRVCVIEGTDNEKILLARTVARGIAINP